MHNGTIEAGGAWRSPWLQEYAPLAVNVDDAEFYGNIRRAVKRDLPWLQVAEAHDGHAVIVGGGPSLSDTLEEIKWRKSVGQTVFALNNTARFLRDHGVEPDKHVLLDARASNARFVINGPEYYIASQCAPETFLAAKNVTLWHPHVEGIHDLIGDRVTALIGGGTTVGLQAISIAFALGYRKIHLFGFDSSYRGEHGHAYAQPENANDEVIEVDLNGRKFACARWMAHQADEFKNVAMQLADADCVLTVAGDGLLPYMARLMMDPPADNAACYDLGEAPASWDFVTWLVNAEMDRRARNIAAPLKVAFVPGPKDGFRDDALPVDAEGRQRFLDNVMRPALSLVGAVEDVTAANGRKHGYLLNEIVARGGEPPQLVSQVSSVVTDWLKSRRFKPGEYITITLREAEHWPQRNSNIAAWTKFAYECGVPVVFVRDTAKADQRLSLPFTICPEASRDVHFRAALYDKAKCNLLVSNGPAMLLFFGRAPFLYFKPLCEDYGPGDPEWWTRAMGIEIGGQLPWASDRQRIIWADDTLENIQQAWAEFGRVV